MEMIEIAEDETEVIGWEEREGLVFVDDKKVYSGMFGDGNSKELKAQRVWENPCQRCGKFITMKLALVTRYEPALKRNMFYFTPFGKYVSLCVDCV